MKADEAGGDRQARQQPESGTLPGWLILQGVLLGYRLCACLSLSFEWHATIVDERAAGVGGPAGEAPVA